MRTTLLFTLLFTHCLALADTLSDRVVHITDGDTIVVLDPADTQYKIRMSRFLLILSYTQQWRSMPGKQSVACGMIPSRCHRGNTEKGSEMEKTPNIADIIGNAFNQERPIQESAADLGAIILEMKREEQYYGKHTRRMVELTMLAEIQERVIHRILDRAIEKSDKPKRPHLKVVK